MLAKTFFIFVQRITFIAGTSHLYDQSWDQNNKNLKNFFKIFIQMLHPPKQLVLVLLLTQ